MSDDLSAIAGEKPPRTEATCRRYAARVEPVAGFLASGALWLFVWILVEGGLAILITVRRVLFHPGSSYALVFYDSGRAEPVGVHPV